MKALSIQQPWAWAILYAGKDIENRTWATKHRGPILIHTGKKFDDYGYNWLMSNKKILKCLLPAKSEFPRGGIIGITEIVDQVESSESPWFFGPWGWLLGYSEPVEFVSCPGKLRIFDVKAEFVNHQYNKGGRPNHRLHPTSE